jgi:hypothetical protein
MQPTRYLPTAITPAPRRPHVTLARRVAMVGAFAAAAITAACGSDSTGPSKVEVTGARPMATARGLAVPHTFTDAAGSKLTIEGGGLTMNADGTYALEYKGKLNALTFELTDEGTYRLAGTIVTFTPEDGDPNYSGRVAGSSVLVDDFMIAGVKFALGFAKH